MRQFIWEYTSGKGKSTYICVFNEAIHLGIYKRKGKVQLYICFHWGNSFGNIKMERESPLIYSFPMRQVIWEYKSGKGKSTQKSIFNCQWSNSVGNIRVERESPLIYSFSTRQFIWEYTSGKGKSTYMFVYIYIFVFNQAFHSGI